MDVETGRNDKNRIDKMYMADYQWNITTSHPHKSTQYTVHS